ncbi:MAG: 4-hydroxybenzoate polyprenyltransferase [Pelagibacterales bacterium]|nr:4-hydroxybenzoate polyprenyltransferase [Pelagibacterales bacterium]
MQKAFYYINLARLNRPTGIYLLFLPCLFGIFLSLKKTDFTLAKSLYFIFIFALGSIFMRSAGCIINDFFDRKFDILVQRTKNRPLASEKITQKEALLFLILLLLVSFLLILQFNKYTILSGFFALILVVTYPLMKRITYYPQIFLGLTFNFGIIISSLAILEKITFECFLLYLSAIIWTLIYDTIYAYQDIEDDLKVGIKSTAIKFGNQPQAILIALTIAMFSLLIYMGISKMFSIWFFALIAAAFIILFTKSITCDFKNPKDCLKVFKDNVFIGSLISLAILLG